jgi:hypothetical protein
MYFLANVTLNDNDVNTPPVGVQDGPIYLTGEDNSKTFEVLQNDYDPDSLPGPITGIIESLPDPSAGTLMLSNGSVLSAGSSFTSNLKFVPATSSWEGASQFSYRPFDGLAAGNVVFVALERPKLKIMIWNGGPGGVVVPEGQEESLGAFTVANWNDTDGDGTLDYIDGNGVVGVPGRSRDEVDLIRIDISKPSNYVGGAVTLTVDSGNVTFWKDSKKVNELVPAELAVWTGVSPKTVWMEAKAPSGAVRDILVTVAYMEQKTRFRATSVWSEYRAVSHDPKTYAELVAMSGFDAFDTSPRHASVKAAAQALNGTGLKNLSDPVGGTDSFFNSIVWAFQVLPSGVGSEPNVKFDITRRIQRTAWQRLDGEYISQTTTNFPDEVENANDDPNEEDESTRPDGYDTMYSLDAPSLPLQMRIPGAPLFSQLHHNYDANFQEFMRVSFDGDTPAGPGVQGTQGSFNFHWHANILIRHYAIVDAWGRAKDDGSTDGPDESVFNAVGEGHRPLDYAPPMP